MVVVITAMHYLTSTTMHQYHDIYRRLYYIPIILGGLWFTVRGGLSVAVLVSTLGFGCHASKDDPEGQAGELSDPVRRENAIYNLKEIYTETLAANGGDRSSEPVQAVSDVIVGPLTEAYLSYPEDRINGLAILDLLFEMQDARSLPAQLEALNWRTEVSEDHAIRAAQIIEAIDVPPTERANVIQALGRSLERITGSRIEDNKMRVSMIRALGSLEDKGATEILTAIATKQDENQNFLINRLAAQQLGELRDASAIPALIKCLFLFAPSNPGMRMNDVAAEALILIGRPSLKPLLNVLAGNDATANAIAKHYIDSVKARRPDLATKMTVRQVTGGEASFALGALGFSEALEPLLQEAGPIVVMPSIPYREAVIFQSPGSPRARGAPWVTPHTHPVRRRRYTT